MVSRAFRILVAVSFLLVAGCGTLAERIIRKPEVEIGRVYSKDATLTGSTVVFVLNLKNPNAFDLPLSSLDYEVVLGGEEFARGTLDRGVNLPANGQTAVEVPLSVEYAKVASGVLQALSGRPVAYVVKGHAGFSALTVPFEEKGELRLR